MKQIRISLSDDDYKYILDQANDRNITLKEYLLMKLMDDNHGIEDLKRSIMKKMPEFYNQAREISDPCTRSWFYDFGGGLCQLLR